MNFYKFFNISGVKSLFESAT